MVTRAEESVQRTTDAQTELNDLLARTAALHRHLCPRQVLGVQMGLCARRWLEAPLPQQEKRVLALVETDGCFCDGLSLATGCTMGHRTMRLIDQGKVAATLVDTETGRAVRLTPLADLRGRALEAYPEAKSRWHAQLEAYQRFTGEELFRVQEVELALDVAALKGRPGARAQCARCGEEILNQREVWREGKTICRACAGESYWRARADEAGR